MNKKIMSILFAFILCICTAIPALAVESSSSDTSENGFANKYNRVLDLANVFSDEEYNKLVIKFDEVSNRQKLDIIICFTNSLYGKSPDEYSKDLYNENLYGYGENKDGVMLLVSFEDRDWNIISKGYGTTAFTDSGIQYIGNQLTDDLANKDYVAASEKYLSLCDSLITDARNGDPYGENFGAEDSGFLMPPPLWILISLIGGLIIAFITVGIMKSKLKTVRMQAAASNYLKKDSLNITESHDIFLYSSISKTPRPKDTDRDNSGSGSSGGFNSGGGKF